MTLADWVRFGALLLLLGAGCERTAPTASAAASSCSRLAPAQLPAPPPPGAVVAGSSQLVPGSFADLAESANPAVVSVKTTVEHPQLGGRVLGQAEGSAFIYSPDGMVLTNDHVIAHAADIRVVVGERRELGAKVVGRDPPTDIAVLKLDAVGLPYLRLGDSKRLRVGDWVVAIGNPFGLSHTVSAGIVSAKGRTQQDVRGLGDGTGYYDFIQTDASINPGNSGGPLLDLSGAVVGINTAIRAEANSIGFAIPIDMVEELLPRLVKDGSIRRSAIGITVSSLDTSDVERLGLRSVEGALVRSVAAGGPADVAGLRVDDIVTGFEGRSVEAPERLRWEASLHGVGKTAALRVRRGAREFVLQVRLGELPQP